MPPSRPGGRRLEDPLRRHLCYDEEAQGEERERDAPDAGNGEPAHFESEQREDHAAANGEDDERPARARDEDAEGGAEGGVERSAEGSGCEGCRSCESGCAVTGDY